MDSSFFSSSSAVKSNTGGSVLVSSGFSGDSSSTGWLLEKKSNTAGLCTVVSGSWDFSGGRAVFSSDGLLSQTSPESINILSPFSLIFSGI